MKKIFFLLIILFSVAASYFVYEKYSYCKVFKLDSPTEVFVDKNKNLIFDENEPVSINNLFLASSLDSEISFEKKMILDYLSQQFASNLLSGKFVKLNGSSFFVDGKDYKELLLGSGYFYDSSVESKEKVKKVIYSINVDDYVIVNIHSATYHKLSCESASKIKHYKIIKSSAVTENLHPCKNCILGENYKKFNYKNEKTISDKQINSVFNIGDISIFFLDLNKNFKPSDKCNTSACKTLVNEINNASKTIDFAIYGIGNQPVIINALKNAKNRGVKIRFVCDFDKNDDNYYSDTIKLKQIFSDYVTDKNYDLNNRSAIMHNKFFIFDNEKVFTGSANISSTDFTDFNSNFSILITSKELAQIYKNEFDQMYSGKFHTLKIKSANKYANVSGIKIGAFFSPQDNIINSQLIPLINKAKNYIYVPIFFITNNDLLNALIAAKNRGVDIKIINDATNAHNKYSIHHKLRQNDILVKTENYAGKLHIKSMIIDDKYSVIGSMNFTNNGDRRNDENVLIFDNKEIAQYLKGVFNYLWAKIPDKYLNYDPKPESLQSIGSCFDGIDNDYDKKIDMEDDGCKVK